MLRARVTAHPAASYIAFPRFPRHGAAVCVTLDFSHSFGFERIPCMSSAAKFFQVIQARDTAAVKRMLSAEPELVSARNEKEQSALLLTAYSGNKELCDVLQAQGILLELHEAAALGGLARVKKLIEGMRRESPTHSPDGFPVI